MTPRPPGLSPHRSTGAGGQSRYEYQGARGAPKRQLYGQPYMRTDPRKIAYIFEIRSNDTRWGQGTAYDVLKIRRVSGVETLSLRDSDLGSFAMPREWTDWAPPGGQACASGAPLVIDAFGLVAVADLIASLHRGQIRS